MCLATLLSYTSAHHLHISVDLFQVLSFDYLGRRVNLLDTPGHQDFSEDTYRTLAACDNAVGARGDGRLCVLFGHA